MAKLFNAYPNLIKKASDPAQVPRKNVHHITRRLRDSAGRLKKQDPSKIFKYDGALFKGTLFPTAPFDSCLTLFAKAPQRYPIYAPEVPLIDNNNLELETTGNEVGFKFDIINWEQEKPRNEPRFELDVIRSQIEEMTLSPSEQHMYHVGFMP